MINLNISKQFSTQYQVARPFPYIVIDNFLPESILNGVISEIDKNKNWAYDTVKWTEPFQVNKFYWPHDVFLNFRGVPCVCGVTGIENLTSLAINNFKINIT